MANRPRTGERTFRRRHCSAEVAGGDRTVGKEPAQDLSHAAVGVPHRRSTERQSLEHGAPERFGLARQRHRDSRLREDLAQIVAVPKHRDVRGQSAQDDLGPNVARVPRTVWRVTPDDQSVHVVSTRPQLRYHFDEIMVAFAAGQPCRQRHNAFGVQSGVVDTPLRRPRRLGPVALAILSRIDPTRNDRNPLGRCPPRIAHQHIVPHRIRHRDYVLATRHDRAVSGDGVEPMHRGDEMGPVLSR